MKINLIWFRNDLRILNNPAVNEAFKNRSNKVLALYMATPLQWKQHAMAPKQAFFIYKNLLSLENELLMLKIKLHYYQVDTFFDSVKMLIKFSINHKINNIYYNYEYGWNEYKRDLLAHKILSKTKIYIYGYHGNMLLCPTSIFNNKKKPYKIYTSFKKNIIEKLQHIKFEHSLLPKHKNHKKKSKIIPFDYPMETFDETMFPVGERKTLDHLKNFCNIKMQNYEKNRNFPFLNQTSLLSASLSIGIISPYLCLKSILDKYPNVLLFKEKNVWLDQILWREFYYYLLAFNPKLSKNKSILKWTENLPWENNKKHFLAWKKGETGFPIVDAGMRQLNSLGWMHNRLRMITASFLVKNLLIDWKIGEKYFMSKLIDGNFASNNGSWQWCASTGYDSMPYFRIFNPLIQSKKFDPSGCFIRYYIPELNEIPNNYIHNPKCWTNKKNIYINYPDPIINYEISRKKMLSIFTLTRNIYNNKIIYEKQRT